MVRILCVGNRFAYPDDFGLRVFDLLKSRPLPADVEVVEGGVGGTSLLPYFEDGAEVLVVDLGSAGMPRVMMPEDVARLKVERYDHAHAFLYLLKSLKRGYRLYLCTEPYGPEDLERHVAEILTLAEAMG